MRPRHLSTYVQLLIVGIVAVSQTDSVVFCQGCPSIATYGNEMKGWAKGSQVKLNPDGIPETMTMLDPQGSGNRVACNDANGNAVNPRAIAIEAFNELTSWNAQNNSGISYSTGASSSKTLTLSIGATSYNGQPTAGQMDWQFDSNMNITSASIKLDLEGAQSPNGYPPNTPWYDCADPTEMRAHIKRILWHETLHMQGLKDTNGMDGLSMMNTGWPRNDHYPGTTPGMAATLNDCDKTALNTKYPASPGGGGEECGNGSCGGGEDCSSCQADCGPCEEGCTAADCDCYFPTPGCVQWCDETYGPCDDGCEELTSWYCDELCNMDMYSDINCNGTNDYWECDEMYGQCVYLAPAPAPAPVAANYGAFSGAAQLVSALTLVACATWPPGRKRRRTKDN
jgi:hypothetical protein